MSYRTQEEKLRIDKFNKSHKLRSKKLYLVDYNPGDIYEVKPYKITKNSFYAKIYKINNRTQEEEIERILKKWRLSKISDEEKDKNIEKIQNRFNFDWFDKLFINSMVELQAMPRNIYYEC